MNESDMPREVVEILAAIRENDIPEWHTLLPAEARRVYDKRVDIFAAYKTEIGSVSDITIAGPAGDLKLRLYAPGPGGPWPVLLYLHGGGWTLGGLESHDELCRRLCVSAETLVVAVDYRLAPEHPFPAALDDSLAALHWIVENIADHGGDAERLATGGDSAGGNLSAAISLHARDHGGPSIALSVLIYPGLTANFDLLSFYENATGKLISTADTIWFWRNYLGPTRAGTPYAEPGTASDLSGVSPTLVITAGFDPLRDDGEIYAHRLRAAGSPVLLKRYPRMIHGFVGLPVDLDDKADALELIARSLHAVWEGGTLEGVR